ncbi:MAG: LysR family transcriptional regulator [Salinisphaera sp.]|nr:LysR family transcriptional regulator [Salinisphaera sp.]
MRLEWIEDLLAVLRTGSLKRAAEERHVSQPAFSRRIQCIEEYVGITLIDRTKKPAQLRETLKEQRPKLEEIDFEIRDLLYELRQADRKASKRIVIAAQHSTATMVAPALIKRITDEMDVEIALISANRAECFFMLATNQAELALTYRYRDETMPLEGHLTEECNLGDVALIPVFGAKHGDALRASYEKNELPIVTYPAEVFLGGIVNREILAPLKNCFHLRNKAETALTNALVQLALEGVGVAWVPESVAEASLLRAELIDLRSTLLSTNLCLRAVRIVHDHSDGSEKIWNFFKNELSV